MVTRYQLRLEKREGQVPEEINRKQQKRGDQGERAKKAARLARKRH